MQYSSIWGTFNIETLLIFKWYCFNLGYFGTLVILDLGILTLGILGRWVLWAWVFWGGTHDFKSLNLWSQLTIQNVLRSSALPLYELL